MEGVPAGRGLHVWGVQMETGLLGQPLKVSASVCTWQGGGEIRLEGGGAGWR